MRKCAICLTGGTIVGFSRTTRGGESKIVDEKSLELYAEVFTRYFIASNGKPSPILFPFQLSENCFAVHWKDSEERCGVLSLTTETRKLTFSPENTIAKDKDGNRWKATSIGWVKQKDDNSLDSALL